LGRVPSRTGVPGRDRRVVHPRARHARRPGHGRDRRVLGHPRRDQTADALDELGVVEVRRRGGTAVRDPTDHERELTAHPITPDGGREVGQRSAQDLLVQLGQLAGERGGTRSEGGGQVVELVGGPVRAEVAHERAGLPGQRGDALAPLCGPARQEALEHEPVGRQARQHQRMDGGDGTGDQLDGHARVDRGTHQHVPGVADAGRACVGRDDDGLAGGRTGDQLRRAPKLGVVVESEHRPVQPVVAQQPAGPPGVLDCDNVRARERLQRPWAQVTEVADRRADQHDPSGCIGRVIHPRRPCSC
jgi:hypothetical protein